MKSGGLKLNKLELLLSLAVVSFIGGPIGYRVYQICNTFAPGSETRSSVIRVSSAKTDSLKLSEYVIINQEDAVEADAGYDPMPVLIDFNSRSISRLSLCNLQIFPAENADEIIPFNRTDIKPMYTFKENILLFNGLDNSLRQASGQ